MRFMSNSATVIVKIPHHSLHCVLLQLAWEGKNGEQNRVKIIIDYILMR